MGTTTLEQRSEQADRLLNQAQVDHEVLSRVRGRAQFLGKPEPFSIEGVLWYLLDLARLHLEDADSYHETDDPTRGLDELEEAYEDYQRAAWYSSLAGELLLLGFTPTPPPGKEDETHE